MSMPSSGSSTTRSASMICSREGMPPRLPEQAHFLAPLPGEEVDPVDELTQLWRVHMTTECVRALSAR